MTVYNAISSNKKRTIIIILLFILFFFTVSYIIGRALGYGLSFAGIMLIISGMITFYSYYYSDKFALSISKAKKADKNEYELLYNTVENLCIATGIPMPKIYIMYDVSPNAFAAGRDPKNSIICVTTGLIDKLKKVELEGVLAHELSHIKNYDTRLMGVVSVLVGSIAILSDIFLRLSWSRQIGKSSRGKGGGILVLVAIIVAITSPIIATLMQLALSRRREYLADADGVLITRYPEGLASALEKISDYKGSVKNVNLATAHFYIENPFKEENKKSWILNLFTTHPPVEERIKILRSM